MEEHDRRGVFGSQGEDVGLAVAGRAHLALVADPEVGERFVIEPKDLGFPLQAPVYGRLHRTSWHMDAVLPRSSRSSCRNIHTEDGIRFNDDLSRYSGEWARSPVECTSSQFLMTSSEASSTLSGVLGAVGSVAGQPTAVGGDKGIDEVLQLPYAR